MKSRMAVIGIVMAVLVMATAVASANGISAWGEQIAGSPGRNAQRNGSSFTIPQGALGTITQVTCDGRGFWVDGAKFQAFIPAEKGKGAQLSAGTYYVFPYLKQDQKRARVSITVTW